MDLKLNNGNSTGYTSNSQIARIITESWVQHNSYCPSCGNDQLNSYGNNAPVADFYCDNCSEDYELKSKSGKLGKTIVDGTYATMIERIGSVKNPNFFFLTYHKQRLEIDNFIIIPKQFFTNDIIHKRKPLSPTARRAGWVGCNISISDIPSLGLIYLVSNGAIQSKASVINSFGKTLFLRQQSLESRGWLIDVMYCVERIENDQFSLKDVYKFEKELQLKHPNNNFVKDKIRQQLQLLRDQHIIEFTTRGNYKKLPHGHL